VTLATHKQRKGVHGLAARAGVRLNESIVRPMDANLVKVTGAAVPSGIPISIDVLKRNNRQTLNQKKRRTYRRDQQKIKSNKKTTNP
jgi:hypothetical protein